MDKLGSQYGPGSLEMLRVSTEAVQRSWVGGVDRAGSQRCHVTKQGLFSAKGPSPFLGTSHGLALASLPFPHRVAFILTGSCTLAHTGARHQS